MTPNHIKLLYVLNALFFCALCAMLLYQHKGLQPWQTGSFNNEVIQPDASTTDAIASVEVGNKADNPAAKKRGSIQSIDRGTILLRDADSGAIYTVSTSAATKVTLVGALKDPAEYQKELDAYYAQVKLLTQDPVKNKAALGELTLPQTNDLKAGSIADLAVGDSIVAIADAPVSGNSLVATKIVKALSQTQ